MHDPIPKSVDLQETDLTPEGGDISENANSTGELTPPVLQPTPHRSACIHQLSDRFDSCSSYNSSLWGRIVNSLQCTCDI